MTLNLLVRVQIPRHPLLPALQILPLPKLSKYHRLKDCVFGDKPGFLTSEKKLWV
ncbi:hypothetical protein COO91_02541 [Nostoc flagelliforme CCNUN1]|uniref:Uncharacterized protein n=1 Tax=Nostoc flagelliforme CCNUN1 TaxID=2038116 RepID=A0A2K8SMN5_9NOSO|nr:hypothetical protein COO91_02541 [Nostoc flagelliforme CCNUN1]